MNETTEATKQFAIQKLYVKDASFESPNSPRLFGFEKWNPKIELNISNEQKHIEEDLYEIVLKITVTVSHEDETAFLVEVQQAGLFKVGGFDEDQKKYLLGSQCLNILFPYAREAISDLSVRGGFPPLTLSPVSFDALYQQHLQRQQAEQGETDATH
ncbi:MAG: protein-export chaperone SecB [Gammaproteobacteria bacterium]|nr:protein-export chaperone SecB [Gammaproteobacteria bacterium]MDH3856546.1 protein-export chaperone SecB [Gammaproteobacteria bacterium]